MKKICSGMLVGIAFMFIGLIKVNAQVVSCSNYDFNFEIVSATERTIRITDYLGSATEVVIPAQCEYIPDIGYTIVEIGDYAFFDQARTVNLTSVTIPSSVETIGERAFYWNELTSVIFEDTEEKPSQLTTIGRYAFCYNNLVNITIPSSVETIEKNAFSHNDLERVVFVDDVNKPSQLLKIGNSAFLYNALENIVIPRNVNLIEKSAFESNKIERAIIPSGIETIERYAFYYNKLGSITIASTVETIGEWAFAYNDLESVIFEDTEEKPSQLTTIGEYAFFNNEIINISIPNNVTRIDTGVFNSNLLTSGNEFIYARTDIDGNGIAEIDTTTLISYGGANKNVIIPKGVITIGEYALSDNELVSVTIPSSVTSVGRLAFSHNDLETVRILSKNIGGYDSSAFDDNHFLWEIYGYAGIGLDTYAEDIYCNFIPFKELTTNNTVLSPITTQTYTGVALTPSFTVIYNDRPLVLGTDYEVTYEDNEAAGIGKAIVAGLGEYAGNVEKLFLIVQEEELQALVETSSQTSIEENPKTFDGIIFYEITGLISLIGLFGTCLCLKRG
ncbi:MAG: leucine-rich repeat domain-containing protein [bacterium]|nr:leucine-rich repeat domain-containing protein [bacterium]